MSNKVLVTGGLGFVGSNLVDKLVNLGFNVDVIDNLYSESSSTEYMNNSAKYYFDDVNNISKVLAGNKYDRIFHLAAEARIQPSFDNPTKWFKSNSMGTIEVMEFARLSKSGIVVYATTSSKNHGSHLISPYTFSKVVGEDILRLYSECYDVNCAMATFYNVYGEREPEMGEWATVVAKFLRQYRLGEPITVVGDGKQSRDFTYVGDICDGLIKISEGHWKADNFDLGRGEPVKIIDLAMKICDGEEDNIKHVPLRKNEGLHTESNWKETENKLGWRATNNLFDYIKKITNND
jgi:UDP-glucose 4-epimerase